MFRLGYIVWVCNPHCCTHRPVVTGLITETGPESAHSWLPLHRASTTFFPLFCRGFMFVPLLICHKTTFLFAFHCEKYLIKTRTFSESTLIVVLLYFSFHSGWLILGTYYLPNIDFRLCVDHNHQRPSRRS